MTPTRIRHALGSEQTRERERITKHVLTVFTETLTQLISKYLLKPAQREIRQGPSPVEGGKRAPKPHALTRTSARLTVGVDTYPYDGHISPRRPPRGPSVSHDGRRRSFPARIVHHTPGGLFLRTRTPTKSRRLQIVNTAHGFEYTSSRIGAHSESGSEGRSDRIRQQEVFQNEREALT